MREFEMHSFFLLNVKQLRTRNEREREREREREEKKREKPDNAKV